MIDRPNPTYIKARTLLIGGLLSSFNLSFTVDASTVYVYEDQNGTRLITNIPSEKSGVKLIKTYEPVEIIRSLPNTLTLIPFHSRKPITSIYDSLIQRSANQYHQDSSLIKAIVHIESSFNADAVSNKGALGLMQLMPSTAEQFMVDDPFDASANLIGGTQYFSQLMERYNNDVQKALAAYNAGPRAVDNHNGIPPFPETQAYVQSVLNLHRQYQDQILLTQEFEKLPLKLASPTPLLSQK